MKVCVVGSGAREHSLASSLARTADVVVTPGNPGIPWSVESSPTELDADLFVIGPEAPLVDGLADELRAAGRLVFGPGADGARLEGSKEWMKDLVSAAGVPTAAYAAFDAREPALDFLARQTPPYVLKTDGLAAGKGVLVTESLTEASNAVDDYLSGAAFGSAGQRVVIEEGLRGPEVSVLAVCDGRRAVVLPPAQDHKRLLEHDEGPNTGGMGAYSPVPFFGPDLLAEIVDSIIDPTIDELRRRGIDYRGVLYAGLMLTSSGPRLIEYNVRFGDPECQVVVPRVESDLAELLVQAAAGELVDEPTVSSDPRVAVVCAAEGYPLAPRLGDLILGLADARSIPGVEVLCAGVRSDGRGGLLTAGGRVLNVCATAATIEEARALAYEGVDALSWPGLHVRRDIARDFGQ